MGDRPDEILSRQALQRLADGRAADSQLFAQPRFLHHRSGRHLQAHDPLEEALVSRVALRPRLHPFYDRHLPHPFQKTDMRPIYRGGT